MTIVKHLELSTGHRLPNHGSKCYNLHGHNYLVELTIDFGKMEGMIETDDGFLVDFGDIKKWINEKFDHQFLIYKKDPLREKLAQLPGVRVVGYIPTVENISLEIISIVAQNLENAQEVDISIEISETENSYATNQL